MTTYRILIVDDQRDVRRVLRSGIETLEHDIKITDVPSGEEAILIISRQPVDLLVADVRLPGISGFELIERAKARNPDLKYFLVTGLTEPRIQRQVANSGAFAFFFKPVDMIEFVDAVERSLGLGKPPELEQPPIEEEPAGPTPSMSMRLSNLHQELQPLATLLIDDRGQVVGQDGILPNLLGDSNLISSLMGVFSAVPRVSQLMGSRISRDIVYFKGEVYDLFMAQVGQSMALLFVVNNTGWGEERTAALFRTVPGAVQDFLNILTTMGVTEPAAPPVQPVTEKPVEVEVKREDVLEILPELDAIFSQAAKPEFQTTDVDAFWDSLAGNEQTDGMSSADAISYEQALQLGLAPDGEK